MLGLGEKAVKLGYPIHELRSMSAFLHGIVPKYTRLSNCKQVGTLIPKEI
jgi:hypothetical protein